MENENILNEEEEVSILTLTDDKGNDVDFEYLDCIAYTGKEYLVLMPMDEESTEIVIQGKVQGCSDLRGLISQVSQAARPLAGSFFV